MRVLLGVLGGLLVLGTASSVLRVLVVPRSYRSRMTYLVQTGVRAPFQWAADRFSKVEMKDAILAVAAPLAIVGQLVAWLLGFLIGYAALLHAFSGFSFVTALRESGSSLFTLGFASNARVRLTTIDFLAAATGPIVIGLQIAYLPTLYSAYSRREVEVTILQSRAGSPAWGPEILTRHVQVELLDNLRDIFRGWERWAADVSESHTSYPILIHFRSTRPTRNWLIALLAVMDAAALQLALNPGKPQAEVRIALRAGFMCLRDLARTEGIPVNDDPSPDDPIQLTYTDFLQGIDILQYYGYRMERSPEEAWPHFRGWRVNYEATAYALAYRIDAVPGPWSGPRRQAGAVVKVVTPVDRRPTTSGMPGTR